MGDKTFLNSFVGKPESASYRMAAFDPKECFESKKSK